MPGDLLLAHGRDPYFPGWPDTLQLNYSNPATQEAMIEELVRIAGQCDGVRCDMAMLVLRDLFAATFAPGIHEAAAVITYLSPGLRFLHQGQFEGRRTRISPHLVRARLEALDEARQRFYDALLAVLRQPSVHDGQWRLLQYVPAWNGNRTWDGFIAWSWKRRTASGD
jgi:hypothetical protein